jgi:hypothetical protein
MAGETLPSGSTNTQGLADWASPYITNYLGQAQALAQSPYQVYQGPLTAGQSDLQGTAFTGLGSLTVPSSISGAATTAGSIATQAAALPAYSPTAFTNQFTAPTASTPTTFTNQYNAPGAYSPTTSSFDATQAEKYMNPYLQASLKPQLDEARRQAQITQAQNASKMTQAGAFGGGRQAILDAETQRSLGSNLANITGQGYNTAFNNAQQQFNADQARKMQEAQFGAQQGMTAAQLQAQFGLSAQQANEAARQFGAQQGMTSAQMSAQYGSEAQRAAEQSKQYGAGYGLQGLQTGLQAAQAQGNLGQLQNQAQLGNINAQLAGGAQQRGITAEGIGADLAEFEKQRQYPYQQVQFQRDMISGLPTGAVTNTPGQMSGIGSLLSTLGGGTAAASALGYKNVGELLTSLGLDLGQKS